MKHLTRQKNLLSIAFTVVFVLIPSGVDAGMTSSQYTLESYSVGGGGQGTTLSSSQYSLESNTQNGKQYTTATPATGGGNAQGSRSTSVSQILNAETEYIGAQIQYEDSIPSAYEEVASVHISEFFNEMILAKRVNAKRRICSMF